MGVDLGGTKIEVAVLDDAGRIVVRERTATPRGSYRLLLEAVTDLVLRIERRIGVTCHVGVGIPGTISPASGLVKNANSTELNGHPFDRDLSRALERPVRVANDANCFAVSEARDGAGAGASIVFGVILGTGVGGGIVVDGRALTGANAIAGEWGHSPLPWPEDGERPGPRCYCGRRGCIETWLSGPALEAHHRRAGGRAMTVAEMAAAAAAGDAHCEATLAEFEQRLARSLAVVMNVLDPHVIVLGGGLANLERLYGRIERLWTPYVFSDRVVTRLAPPAHGDSSGVRGAAWLWDGD